MPSSSLEATHHCHHCRRLGSVLWVVALLLSSRRYRLKKKNEHVGRVGIIMDRRLVLTLLEELSQAGARAEQETRRGIKLEGTGKLLHGLPI